MSFSPLRVLITLPVLSIASLSLQLFKQLSLTFSEVGMFILPQYGEMGAAYATGAITTEEAIVISYYRGFSTRRLSKKGAMAAVGLGRRVVTPFLARGIVVACENSPENITLSGDTEALDEVCTRLLEARPVVFIRRLRVNIAYHSSKIMPCPLSLTPHYIVQFVV